MTDPTTAYLAELERAVRELPQPLAGDIVGGIREELRGLDADEARERIAALGEPAAIAAAARDELPPATPAAVAGDARWYTVVTVLLVGIGGFVVPVLGWVVGIGFLWASRTWTRRDKIIGTLILPVAIALTVGALALVGPATGPSGGGVDPLVPGFFRFGHTGVVVTAILAPIASAGYLLVRYRRLGGVVKSDREGDPGWYTALVLVLLLIGGIVVPYVGWIVGVVLLWGSRTWRTVDKIIGTLAPPLGGVITLWFWTRPAYTGTSVSIETENGVFHGAEQIELLMPLPVLVLWWIGAALPVITFVYLLVRARILRR